MDKSQNVDLTGTEQKLKQESFVTWSYVINLYTWILFLSDGIAYL